MNSGEDLKGDIMNIVINVNENPIERKHISYNVSIGTQDVILYEIEEVSYEHPNSQGYSTISRIEENKVCSYKIWDKKASPLILLKHMLNTVKLLNLKGD